MQGSGGQQGRCEEYETHVYAPFFVAHGLSAL